MGLFSSKSKSSSSTSYSDNSTNTNLQVDLSGGDLSSGASKNIVSGGDIYYAGLSEDLASQVFGVVADTFNSSLDWVDKAIKQNNTQTQKTLDFLDSAITKSNSTLTSNLQSSTQQLTASLAQAYNSEQATITSFKTYALYALIGFIAWAYLGRKN